MIDRRRLLLGASALAAPIFVRTGSVARAEIALPSIHEAQNYTHPEWLVDSRWLREHVQQPNVKVIALQKVDDFALGHIPGALHVDYVQLDIRETGEASLDLWRKQVAATISVLGIEFADTVIVYDGGNFHAARLWWALDQVGHQDKRILDGGLPAWSLAGGITSTSVFDASPAGSVYPVSGNARAIASIDEVVAAFESEGAVFVDARTAIDYAAGHIPGALSVPIEVMAESTGPMYWKSAEALSEIYSSIPKDAFVIPYCGAGIRSAGTYFALLQLGYENVALFSGSFNEWSAHPELPVAVGDMP